VLDIGYDDADRLTRPASQAAGYTIRPVPQLPHRFQDALPDGSGDQAVVVQYARDGRGRNSGPPRDILHRGHMAFPGIPHLGDTIIRDLPSSPSCTEPRP